MKKKISVILIITLLLQIFTLSAFCAGDFAYTVSSEGSVTITGYTGADTRVEIPAEIEGKPVRVIRDGAFRFKNTIKSVRIPESVRLIETRAFDYCTALESVELCEGVETFGDFVFNQCIKLEKIRIPDSVTAMGVCVFAGCTSLTEAYVSSVYLLLQYF